MTLLLTVLTFSLERYYTIKKAHGNIPPVKFVSRLKEYLAVDDITGAKLNVTGTGIRCKRGKNQRLTNTSRWKKTSS